MVQLAACQPSTPQVTPVAVRPGLEVLISDSLALVRGRRVGIVTNQSAVDQSGVHAVDRLLQAGVNLTAILSPEHGFRGTAAPGEVVASSVDSATGLPIYSLYTGSNFSPTPAMLENVDVILIDLQDVGARYFTWVATAVAVMEVAAREKKPVVILDRPNPIAGVVQGNVLDPAFTSSIGRLAVPMRHGLTLGEEARLAAHDLGLTVDLRVVPVAGWRRSATFSGLGLPFIAPSPNLRDLEALFHYPGTCLFEGTALSVGRGTDAAFRQVGAPWLDTARVLLRMKAYALPGVSFSNVSFTPRTPGDGKYADTTVAGIRFMLTDPSTYDPTLTAVTLLSVIQQVHPDRIGFIPRHFDRLAGGAALREAITRGETGLEILESWRPAQLEYQRRARSFRIYEW
ncbi:MAG TPA: DUF1343 domain-containing protein [Gemmatimonadales bacterium]|nr:DUF1343 domain-containing protein [Gemmatimonadales bacterium]